jgi:hypothetical protein
MDPVLILDSHMNYLDKVSDYIEGNADDPGITPHTECLLGSWYYGEAAQDDTIAKHEDYDKLGNLHEQFHELTAEAVHTAKDDADTARAKVSEAYVLFGQISNALLKIDESIHEQ